MDARALWNRYSANLVQCPGLGLTLDYSRMSYPESYFTTMGPAMQAAFAEMQALEAGAIANPDEGRMVGHYWLRDPERAPTPELRAEIEWSLSAIKSFARSVHDHTTIPPMASAFTQLLVIGIGGSALGPQFVGRALAAPDAPVRTFYFDNTDPDGFDTVLARLSPRLPETLCVTISKSGSTKETRNGMVEAISAFEQAGLDFGRQAVAITGKASHLDHFAEEHQWLARFPMWDWVGGRTSELAAVGLLPATLQGIDVDSLLAGARAMDACTRHPDVRQNPAALLALMWYHAGDGQGRKHMVILPYKDRLELFARYLQQLVMESLGKEVGLSGEVVHQGIPVYGNKGSTDQHAYVQQLREGPNDFFATFIEVLRDRSAPSMRVEDGVTAGDLLSGFLHGTRQALYEAGRESLTITVDQVDARTVGALIALYERAVGFYASLIGVNAYHQPGVEAGKLAGDRVIALQRQAVSYLRRQRETPLGAEQIASAIGAYAEVESVYHALRHVAANPDHGILAEPGATPAQWRFWAC